MLQQPPVWMESLVDEVANCIEAHSPMGPLGYRYLEEDELGELIVYPTPVELVGGALDGEVVFAGFSLDLRDLISTFEHVTAIDWCTHSFGPYDSEGPHISVEGIYQGHHVWLRVLSHPPDDEEPGLQLDTISRTRAGG